LNRKQFITSLGISALSGSSLLKAGHKTASDIKLPSAESWEQVQKQFSVFKKHIYMNNGTMGLTPKPVLKSLEKAFSVVANTGAYPSDVTSLKTKLAGLLDVNVKTIAITKNVTEGINIACWGQNLREGDEVLMTKHEHVGGCAAWLYRAKTQGIKIRTFELGKTADETLENFKKAITQRTKVAAVPHIPCTIGQILPVKEICTVARNLNIVSIIDGAHPLGMLKISINDIGCDYYSGCLHKWLLAPLGIGFIYINEDKLNATNIYNVGAYSVPNFDMTSDNLVSEELVASTQRYSTGTFCGPLYVAAETAIEWYQAIGAERIEKRIKELSLFTQEELQKLSADVEILSPIENISRGAQTAFRFKSKKASDFIGYARQTKDSFILRHVHEAKLDAVRVSTHYYNDFSQIEKLVRCVKEYASK
jgi:selenocysteine lyase/cysteine desulfurase